MNPRRLLWITPLLGVALLAGPAFFVLAQEPAPATSINWRLDYNAARKEADEKKLPLLIDFGTQSCFWCKKLDESTFKDPKIIAVMNERFIPLKVDAEREPTLTSSLRIASYPTVVMAGPDGKILGTMEGFQNAEKFGENMLRALATVTPPDWMQRDLQLAQKWIQGGDYARAIASLKNILDDGKARPVQADAQKMLADIEQKGAQRLARAKQLQANGKQTEAVEVLGETIRTFPGLAVSREATDLLTRIAQSQSTEAKTQQRSKRANELLAQAKEFYKTRDYIPCMDRCEILLASFGDLPEGQEGALLVNEIRNNPEWLQNAADTMSERLGGVYLALADTLLKKGQPQRAEFYLQRVIQAFPGSRQAESAQIRLSQLQGTPVRPTDVQSARP